MMFFSPPPDQYSITPLDLQTVVVKQLCPSFLMEVIKRTEIVKNFAKYSCAPDNVTLHICAGKTTDCSTNQGS